MQIAGSDFLYEQNNRLRNSLLDYSQKVAENASAQKPAEVPAPEVAKKSEESIGATLSLSSDAVRSVNFNTAPETSTVFAPTEFSTETKATENAVEAPKTAEATKPETDVVANQAVNGNSVLNQYRFFVQSAMYQGEEGNVRRIS